MINKIESPPRVTVWSLSAACTSGRLHAGFCKPGRARSLAIPCFTKGEVCHRGASELANTKSASKLTCKHMMTSQFRSERGKTRKREISRDFSRFFDPEFFLSFIDPFCPFRCCVRTRTHEKGFFASSRKQSTLWLDSDLRKRNRTVRKSRRFTNCLQTHLIPPQIVRI